MVAKVKPKVQTMLIARGIKRVKSARSRLKKKSSSREMAAMVTPPENLTSLMMASASSCWVRKPPP